MPKVNRKRTETPTERMQRFMRYVEAKVPIGDAIRFSLSPEPFDRKLTQSAIPDFAARHSIPPKLAASVIYGTRRATPQVCRALALEFGEDAEWWRALLSPTRESALAS